MQSPDRRRSPAARGDGATSNQATGSLTTIAEAADHLAHFQRRVLIEAMLDGWGATWERRARALEAARPAPGDFHGGASRQELRERHQRLTDQAAACRRHATIAPLQLATETVDAVFGEAS